MAQAQQAQDPYIGPILAQFKSIRDHPWRTSCRPLTEFEERLKQPYTTGQRIWRNMFGWDEIGKVLALADQYSSDPTILHGYTFYELLNEVWLHMSDRSAREQTEIINALKATILTSADISQTARITRLAKVMGALLRLPVVIGLAKAPQQPTVESIVASIRGRVEARAIGDPTPAAERNSTHMARPDADDDRARACADRSAQPATPDDEDPC